MLRPRFTPIWLQAWLFSPLAGTRWTLAQLTYMAMFQSAHPSCHVCGVNRYRELMMRCATCGRLYCSKECSKKDRPNHTCQKGGKPPTTDEALEGRQEWRQRNGGLKAEVVGVLANVDSR